MGVLRCTLEQPASANNTGAMNPAFKPWDNKLVRQAVAYAVDRDAIIKSILLGFAERLADIVAPDVSDGISVTHRQPLAWRHTEPQRHRDPD